MEMPNDCSWVWRSILKTRESAMTHIKYLVAYGQDILLWEDPWSSLGPLRKVAEVVSSWGALLPSNVTLDSIIGNNSWQQSMFSHLPTNISETLQK
ncbi:hypothetical protein FRX31_014170, partial [Thalictrum thalictroides]